MQYGFSRFFDKPSSRLRQFDRLMAPFEKSEAKLALQGVDAFGNSGLIDMKSLRGSGEVQIFRNRDCRLEQSEFWEHHGRPPA
jgi:hypothetical protein